MKKDVFVKLEMPTEETMLALGNKLAAVCGDTAIIYLYGQLGAGKTTLARGFLRGLGYLGHVKSPTYTLVESYSLATSTVYHFDLYRLHAPEELEYIGIQDYFLPSTICLIEWPEQGKGKLPQPDLSCYLQQIGQGREVKIVPESERGATLLHRFEHDK